MGRIKPYVVMLFLGAPVIVSVSLLFSSCATKKYVRNSVAPVQAQVDQVGAQTNKYGQSLEETRKQVNDVDERAQSGISAAQERASTADQHAGDAIKAIQNIDDYRLQTSVRVPFRFDDYTLSKAAKQDLDRLADDMKATKRFFIAVEGYTDKTGSVKYNETLSRRRADSVVEYLVAEHQVPIYRIHMIGLGEHNPVDERRGREASAKNRRVEVKVYSADHVTASLSGTPGSRTADQTAIEKPNQ